MSVVCTKRVWTKAAYVVEDRWQRSCYVARYFPIWSVCREHSIALYKDLLYYINYYINESFITVQIGRYSLTRVLKEVTASEQGSENDLRVYVRNLFSNMAEHKVSMVSSSFVQSIRKETPNRALRDSRIINKKFQSTSNSKKEAAVSDG